MPSTTFFPDASVESTSVDGYVASDTNAVWATVHDAGTGGSAFDSEVDIVASAEHNGTNYRIRRGFMLFDTSSLGTDTVKSATLSMYVRTVTDQDNGLVNVFSSTPASDTALGTADYDQIGDTAFSTAIDITSLSTSAYNDYILNASGLAAVVNGISKFSFRESHDSTDTPTSDSVESNIQSSAADTAGATQDPRLVVFHDPLYKPRLIMF